jgi:hypothetical protein
MKARDWKTTRGWTAEDDCWLRIAQVWPAALKRTRSAIRNGIDRLRALWVDHRLSDHDARLW